jgi:hypothetical protein
MSASKYTMIGLGRDSNNKVAVIEHNSGDQKNFKLKRAVNNFETSSEPASASTEPKKFNRQERRNMMRTKAKDEKKTKQKQLEQQQRARAEMLKTNKEMSFIKNNPSAVKNMIDTQLTKYVNEIYTWSGTRLLHNIDLDVNMGTLIILDSLAWDNGKILNLAEYVTEASSQDKRYLSIEPMVPKLIRDIGSNKVDRSVYNPKEGIVIEEFRIRLLSDREDKRILYENMLSFNDFMEYLLNIVIFNIDLYDVNFKLISKLQFKSQPKPKTTCHNKNCNHQH